MSVSMDKGPAGEGEDSRGVLASWLDDYIGGRCDRADMQSSFLSVCRSNPDAPWDALALLDQYQRRGRIDVQLARSLKADIAQLVFGVANETDTSGTGKPEAEPTLDTSGTRWRKMMAERQPASINADESFVDPTLYRRDADPPTRPPMTERPADAFAPERAQERRAPADGVLRGRYELLGILGRGGSGTVYRALDRHRGHLPLAARCVAVKVLKLNYADRPDALADLEHEFHQAQSLAHPNIVSVFDLDRDRDTYFIVMELLDGELLADTLRHLEGRPMARDHALGIVSSIGAALAHAHRRNILHGDLKPRNVMITGNGEVRVLDFGFAQHRPLEPWVADSLHDTGAVATPGYASIERVNGDEPSPADDVYSLACITYELLAGRHPFGGRSAALAKAHGREPQRIAGLSSRQWQALHEALQWSRAERKITVVELLAALGCAQTPQQLASPTEIAASPIRVSGRWGTIALVTFALLALGAAGVAWLRSAGIQLALPSFSRPAQPEAVSSNRAPEQFPTEAVETTPLPVAKDLPSQPAPERPAAAPAAPPPATGQMAAAPKAVAPATTTVAPAPAQQPAGALGVITFDKDTYVATESDASVRLTVKRSGAVTQAASFRWILRSNSADAGADYAAIGPGLEQFPAGARQANIVIPLVQDSVAENTELFLVELESVDGGPKIGELARAAVIIVDDDG